MKNKIHMNILVVFIVSILTVLSGCGAAINNPPKTAAQGGTSVQGTGRAQQTTAVGQTTATGNPSVQGKAVVQSSTSAQGTDSTQQTTVVGQTAPAGNPSMQGKAAVQSSTSAQGTDSTQQTTAVGQTAPADQCPLPKNLTLKLNEHYPPEKEKTLKTLGVTWYGNNMGNRVFSLDNDKIVANQEGEYTWDYGTSSNKFSITVTVVKATVPQETEFVPQEKESSSVVESAPAIHPKEPLKVKRYTVVKTDWIYGITPPQDSEIVQEKTGNDIYRNWPESQTTTWFNALKLAYSHGAGGFTGISDASLCYGLTAANMLHWWIKQNEASLQDKGITVDDLAYSKSDTETKSGIAEIVRTGQLNHGGRGGDTREVLWWFLNNKLGIDKSETEKFVKDTSVGSKEEFERYLNEAITNREAVAITYHLEDKRGKHVVNVWGISKDEQGNIVELWIGDSNLGNPTDGMRGSKLYPWGIHYHGGKGNPYLVNAGNLTVTHNKIETVIRLNLGQN